MCILFTESRPPCLAVFMGVLSRVDSFGIHQSSESKWAVCAPSKSTLLFPRVHRVQFKKYFFYPYRPEDQDYNSMPTFSYQKICTVLTALGIQNETYHKVLSFLNSWNKQKFIKTFVMFFFFVSKRTSQLGSI